MPELRLNKINAIINLALFLSVLLQATKYFLIFKAKLSKKWQRYVLKIGSIAAMLLNPVMIWFGIFGDYRTLLVILAYISFQLLLILDILTSVALWKQDSTNESVQTLAGYRQPALICLCGYIGYILIRVFSLLTMTI